MEYFPEWRRGQEPGDWKERGRFGEAGNSSQDRVTHSSGILAANRAAGMGQEVMRPMTPQSGPWALDLSL